MKEERKESAKVHAGKGALPDAYDFDRLTDRRGTYSYKWDVAEGELPMWVADMDFVTAPAVLDAIVRRAEHGIFGYSSTPDEYFLAVSAFFGRRHGFAPPTEWMVYSNGIVAAIGSVIRRLTHPGENVLIQAPVYNIFYNSILNNGRNVISSDLVYDGGKYIVDYIDLEAKLALKQTSLMILCNPHNPVGLLWSREELCRIGELCKRHGVVLLSDEIHCDFVTRGRAYTPFCSIPELRDISVSCVSPSKSFNIAGLQSATVIIPDPVLRHRVWRGINTEELGEPNAFAMSAGIAAYRDSDGWLDGLVDYIFENRALAQKYIAENIPQLRAVHGEATYLLWIDVSGVCEDSVAFTERLRELTGLYLSEGREYGECGRSFVRMNLATQRSRVLDGLDRLRHGVEEILAEKK